MDKRNSLTSVKKLEKKIKVAFIYEKSSATLSTKYHNLGHYNFFMNALQRNKRLEVINFPSEKKIDVRNIAEKFDIILLHGNQPWLAPELIGIHETDIPVICKSGDTHSDSINAKLMHEKYKINHYFSFYSPNSFYKYFPKHFKYSTIVYGLEPSLYQNVTPYNQRIKPKILNSGVIGTLLDKKEILKEFPSRLRSGFKKRYNRYKYYKLRTKCTKLPYVDYFPIKTHEFVGDKYTLLLQKYCAAIAATTVFITQKYLEIPAAGCLTFMEITEENDGEYFGFIDGDTAIFINENNYKEKFEEYLKNVENPKWKKIANNGREYVLKEFNNDKAVESLIHLTENYI